MADRRTFLGGLATLPLIGGSVALVGNPTAAAVPPSPQLLESYRCWLHYEHWALAEELAEGDAYAMDVLVNDHFTICQAVAFTLRAFRRPRLGRPWL